MTKSANVWKSRRGALGPLQPLLGDWHYSGQTKLGATECRRQFEAVLGGK